MSEYQNLLSKYKSEFLSPYNDGWSQMHFKEKFEELLKMGEKNYNKQQLKEKINNLQKTIDYQKNILKELKEELKNIR